MRLQDLPRHLARRCLDVPRFCRTVLNTDIRGATIVVAYSTGLDSSALLHLLHLLRPGQHLRLVAAHAHHGLRPESDGEEAQAVEVCRGLDIPCITARLDVPSHLHAGRGAEDTARGLRYAFLEEVRSAHGADWIVTAHHADDLIEDVLMRLLRGTGWPGLGGMPGVDAERRLLRPLLSWNKSEFPALMHALGAGWNEDPTNADTTLTRNRIRHTIVPLLRRENPGLARTIMHLWRLAGHDSLHWKILTERLRSRPDFLGTDLLDAQDAACRLRLYKSCLDSLGPGQVLADHLFALDDAWVDRRKDIVIQFPGDKTATITRLGIAFAVRTRP